MINRKPLNYQSIKFTSTSSILCLKKTNLIFFLLFLLFFCSMLSLKIGRPPASTSEDPKLKTCSFYDVGLFKSQILKRFDRFWRFVITLKLPMKKLQNSSKTHFFSYCLSFRRWPAKSKAAGGVININLLFLYRISISKNFFMMLRQVFWICYRFREPPCFPGNRGGVLGLR